MLNIQKNITLAPYTTYRIGGPARFFVVIKNKEELIEAINWAKKQEVKYFILGGGSNILFSDDGYDGLVIKMENLQIEINGNKIYCEAGATLAQLASQAMKAGLSGLEWSAGVPGTIGGAISGNAGTLNGCMANNIESVEVFDGEAVKILLKTDLNFTYRTSIFKQKSLIILSANLLLKNSDLELIKQTAQEYFAKKLNSQPKGFSAGSVFKNPPSDFAGRLIEQCGLKGEQIGGAQISLQHANFIINTGEAKASDVLSLINLIKQEVKNKLNIVLEEEIRLV